MTRRRSLSLARSLLSRGSQHAHAALYAFVLACGAPLRYFSLFNADAADWVAAAAPVAATLEDARFTCVMPAQAALDEGTPLTRMFASVRFPALRSLRLSTKIDVQLAAAVLHACPLVTSLSLDGCELQPAAAAMLLAKPGLLDAHLHAIVVTQPDMAFWAPLALCNPTLCSLYVECCKYLNFTDAPELPALRTLLLHDTNLFVPYGSPLSTDMLVQHMVASSSELRHLELAAFRHGPGGTRGMTDGVLPMLAAQCPLLQQLHISPGTGDRPLRSPRFVFPHLRKLTAHVNGTPVLACPQLIELSFAGASNRARDCRDTVSHASTLSAAGSTQLGDAGALALADCADGLPKLAVLDLTRCDLHVPTLWALAPALPLLRRLTARGNWVHPHEAAAARTPRVALLGEHVLSARPRCRVLHPDAAPRASPGRCSCARWRRPAAAALRGGHFTKHGAISDGGKRHCA
jgi:hypothetical protein